MRQFGVAAFALIVPLAVDPFAARSAPPESVTAAHHPVDHRPATGAVPAETGQAAFAAIQEIVARLRADPRTDWDKVDIDALREHLIDMDEVTMRATVRKTQVENGIQVFVTGAGRTLEAIQRMVPSQAKQIDGSDGWTARTSPLPDGVALTVTSASPTEGRKIRALGFMGIMTTGAHHQMHHLAIAKGEPIHSH